MIVYLHGQYLQGVYEVPAAQIVEDLDDFAAGARIDKLFKDSPAWNRLLTQRSGICSFCWPAEEGDGSGNEGIAAE